MSDDKYIQRAAKIHNILTTARRDLAAARSYSDRAATLVLAVETINTILHTFDFAPDLYSDIDERLNNQFKQMKDESDINRLTITVAELLDILIKEAEDLKSSYRETA